ncbi:TetR/AcrR family transcriptional regulator [Bradyrhizobium sp.]|uniref:TetR/AcrR family transcriptional regulator n=1 Tax=Bradyrhizobium sp. TaxID=376 RepID=UPI003C3F62FD
MASATQEAILDAAEQVFASHGYEGAAMREIAKRAGVNQALLHYHFATKDNLYERVVERRSSAINNYRIELLDALDADGSIPSLEQLLHVLYAPHAYMRGGSTDTVAAYTQMILAITIGSDERSKALMIKYFDGIARRFIDEFMRVLPGLSRSNAVWAYLFALGVRAQVHARNNRAVRLSDGLCDNTDLEKVVALVVPFVAAGIRQLAAISSHSLLPPADQPPSRCPA